MNAVPFVMLAVGLILCGFAVWVAFNLGRDAAERQASSAVATARAQTARAHRDLTAERELTALLRRSLRAVTEPPQAAGMPHPSLDHANVVRGPWLPDGPA